MDLERYERELNEAKQTISNQEADLRLARDAAQQLLEENQALSTQLDQVMHENTAKIEVCFVLLDFKASEFQMKVRFDL